jgi:uncharacterized protein with HEPN domain
MKRGSFFMQHEALGILLDIRDASRFIAEDTEDAAFETFVNDRRIYQLVAWNLTIIGEAVNRLHRRYPDVAERISDIPQIVGLRNLLIHAYDRIDHLTVWSAVQESLPKLRREVEAILEAEGVD